jgi:hypothetical protein
MNLVFIPRSVGRESRRSVFAAGLAHLVGAGLSGAAVFGLVSLIGASAARAGLDGRTLLGLFSFTLALITARSQWLGKIAPLPERRGQVPRLWVGWRHQAATAFAFGLLLGSGFSTFLEVASVYVVLLAALLSQSVPLGILIGAVYGISRGTALLAAIASGVRSSDPRQAAGARARQLSAAARRALPAATVIAVVLISLQDVALFLR